MALRVVCNPDVFKESTDQIIDFMKKPVIQTLEKEVEYSVKPGVHESAQSIKEVITTNIPIISSNAASCLDSLAVEVRQCVVNVIFPKIES